MTNSTSLSRSKFALVVAAAMFTCAALNADIISFNATEFTGDVQQINSDESYGIGSVFGIDTTVSNWTNTNSGTEILNLPWSDGSSSTVSYTGTRPDGSATFNAVYDDTPLKAGFDVYTATANPVTITFSNLSANFSAGYFAIVYLNGFNSNTGSSISDGTTTFYWTSPASPALPATLVQATDTSDPGNGNFTVAQYAIFGSDSSPLTADTITFEVDTLYGGGSAIGGVQLVAFAVPEPATYALGLGVIALGLVVLRRRRK